jgi:hypothetical protein
MSGLFKTPSMPAVQNTVTPTTVTDDSKKVADERKRFAMRRGRAANILTQDYRTPAGKSLLGE